MRYSWLLSCPLARACGCMQALLFIRRSWNKPRSKMVQVMLSLLKLLQAPTGISPEAERCAVQTLCRFWVDEDAVKIVMCVESLSRLWPGVARCWGRYSLPLCLLSKAWMVMPAASCQVRPLTVHHPAKHAVAAFMLDDHHPGCVWHCPSIPTDCSQAPGLAGAYRPYAAHPACGT